MPVDLSTVGLQGIQASDESAASEQTRLESIARTRKMELENQVTARDIEIGNTVAAMLQKLQSGDAQPDAGVFFDGMDESSDATPLEVVGHLALRMGGIKQGTDALKAASDIHRDEALNERNKFENAKDHVETVLKTANAVAQTIGVAQNESEWRYGLAQLRKNQVLPDEQLAQLESMDYDPDVVAYLNSQALTAYQKAQLDLISSRDATNKRQADARIDNARNLTSIAKARLKLAEEAAARANKTGKSASAPNRDQLAAAESAVVSQIFGGRKPTSPEAKAAMAAGVSAIASRTQALLRENKAMDFETAQNRAIIESQAAGDWKIDEPGRIASFFGAESKTKFGAGKTPATAIVLPEDPKKLVKGKFYITSKGKAKWNGSAFEAISE